MPHVAAVCCDSPLVCRGATDADLAGSRSVYNSDGVWTRIAEHHAPLLPPGYGHFSAALSFLTKKRTRTPEFWSGSI